MLYKRQFPNPDMEESACEYHARTVVAPEGFRPMSDDEIAAWSALILDERGHDGLLCDWCSWEVAEQAEAILGT